MRIALVTPSFWPRVGGLETAVGGIGKGLRAMGHDVLIITTDHTSPSPPEVDPSGLPVIRVSSQIDMRSSRAPRRTARHLWTGYHAFRTTLRNHCIDLVHIHFLSQGDACLCAAAARRLGLPIVATAHGSDLTYHIKRSRLRRRMVAFVLRASAQTTCVSLELGRIAEGFRRPPGSGVHIVPNGVAPPPDARDPEFAVPKPFILAAGRLVPEKGFRGLLRLFSRLRRQAPAHSLIIAGDGPVRQSLEKDVQALDLTGWVLLPGMLPHDVLWRLMQEADLFVCSSEREGTPIVVLEAMYCGRPVVSMAVGCVPELIHEGVDGLVVGSDVELQAALARLVSDADLRREMGRNAAMAAREFTWDRAVRGYLAVYEQALAR